LKDGLLFLDESLFVFFVKIESGSGGWDDEAFVDMVVDILVGDVHELVEMKVTDIDI